MTNTLRHTVQELANWFASLSPDSLSAIGQYYAPDAYFKDPFNEVNDTSQIERIFADMFNSYGQPHFLIQEQICDETLKSALLTWQFRFQWRGKDWCIIGSSHLRFSDDGLVTYHRDYWDAAEELYEKLPVIGFVLRALKKRAQK